MARAWVVFGVCSLLVLSISGLARADEPAVKKTSIPSLIVPDDPTQKQIYRVLDRILLEAMKWPLDDAALTRLAEADAALTQLVSKGVDDRVYRDIAQLRYVYVLRHFGGDGGRTAKQALLQEISSSSSKNRRQLAEQLKGYDLAPAGGEMTDAMRNVLTKEFVKMMRAAEPHHASLYPPFYAALEVNFSGGTEPKTQLAALQSMELALKQFDESLAKSYFEKLNRHGKIPRLLGKPMELTGTTIDGKPFDISELKGKVVLVEFWATWCPPCRAEMPNLLALYDGYHEKGFEIVGISHDYDKGKLEAYLAENNITWPMLLKTENVEGKENIAERFGVNGIPTTILVNKAGNVVQVRTRGRALQAQLAKLLGPPLRQRPIKDIPESSSSESGTSIAELPPSN